MSFQKDNTKAPTKRFIILDERRLLIKEKIKTKVKEQLEKVLKRMDFISIDQNNVQIKDDSLIKSFLQVNIKGNSVKKSLRNSLSSHPDLVKSQKYRSIDNRTRSEIRYK